MREYEFICVPRVLNNFSLDICSSNLIALLNMIYEIIWRVVDLGYQGSHFTWCNNRVDSRTVWERLDHGLATTPWLNIFLEAQVIHLHASNSDHYPICLVPTPEHSLTRAKHRLFRFEEVWLSNPSCRETVTEAWATKKPGLTCSMCKTNQKLP